MKKQTLFWGIVLLSALLLSACQAAPASEQPPEETTEEIKYAYGDRATVESISVLLLESFPLQARAVVTGYVPDGCTELDEINVEFQNDTFVLIFVTRSPVGDIGCTEALVPFEESVPLDIAGFNAGTYKVVAQNQSAEFTLDMDNVLATDEPSDNKYSFGSDARVEEMYVKIMESYPVQVSVNLIGYLPDGCTQIDEVTSQREGDVFTVEIITKDLPGIFLALRQLSPLMWMSCWMWKAFPLVSTRLFMMGWTKSLLWRVITEKMGFDFS